MGVRLTPVYPAGVPAPAAPQPRLWLPPTAVRDPKVAEHLVDSRKDYNARLLQLFHVTGWILDEWNRELANIDQLLRLGQAFETIPAGYPVIPGYFHLLRLNPNAPFSVTPITGPNGQFAVPTSQMLDRLRESDLQHKTAVEARRVQMENQLKAEERDKARFRESRREELFDRARSAYDVQISFSPEHKWTQNVNGKRGGK